MNERVKELIKQATVPGYMLGESYVQSRLDEQKFAELIVAKVLDEVAERAYYSGDRAWSDELDRPWIELEFGIGKLAELKNEQSKI